MVARGDRHSFEYEVAYVLAAEHALVPDIASTGTPVHGLEGRGNADLRWMGRLRRLIVDGRFDVVHFHLPYTAALGRLVVATLPSGRRPAVVYTEHSLWNKMAVLIKGLNRATIGRDQALVVVSEAAHDALPHRLKAARPGHRARGGPLAFGCPDRRQGRRTGRGTGRARRGRARSFWP